MILLILMNKKGQTIFYVVLVLAILVLGSLYWYNAQSPYISKMSLENNFVEQGSNFKIFYKIKNTQKTPLEPLIKIVFNEDCFRVYPEDRILDAIGENQEKAYFLEITSIEPRDYNKNCTGEQAIVFDLYDKDSENKLDTESVSFEIVNG